MKFHLPSFLIGWGAGYATKSLGHHFRPFVVEVATLGYRLADAAALRFGRAREDLEDAVAEAKAKASALKRRHSATQTAHS